MIFIDTRVAGKRPLAMMIFIDTRVAGKRPLLLLQCTTNMIK